MIPARTVSITTGVGAGTIIHYSLDESPNTSADAAQKRGSGLEAVRFLWEADNHGYWSFKGIRGRHKDGTINVGLHRRFQF